MTVIRDCFQCAFAERMVGNDGKIDFNAKICKLNPPFPLMVPTPRGTVMGTAFPTVTRGLWCFKFEAREGVEEPLPEPNTNQTGNG